ncbi:hypothetical protein KVT40_006415 [Elsinoe batatas]|uniref:Uncharacterized protein n=1 Tax=Elsinoe batatas TaxID=2601811 RepID=A0A8K0KXW7_9PEZI|nr:hypothetical protein KVT40_006415 [Elsinoe batatas]
MAAKLRASFYHVFCLFHNHPPISQLTPPKTSPNGKTDTTTNRPSTDTRARQAVLRETIPSMTSDASYVTNPYAFTGPAQTSPPPYPPPPVPTIQSLVPGTPLRPPGLGMTSPVQRSPPSSADFLMPPLNFVPAASAYFSQATVLARRLLPGSDPLRLSVAFESCAFSWECGKDFALAKEKAKATIRDVYSAPEGMEDADLRMLPLLYRPLQRLQSAVTQHKSQVDHPLLSRRFHRIAVPAVVQHKGRSPSLPHCDPHVRADQDPGNLKRAFDQRRQSIRQSSRKCSQTPHLHPHRRRSFQICHGGHRRQAGSHQGDHAQIAKQVSRAK